MWSRQLKKHVLLELMKLNVARIIHFFLFLKRIFLAKKEDTRVQEQEGHMAG